MTEILSTPNAENRCLDGELICVIRDLKTYRDQNLTAYSEDSRDRKEELAKLRGVEKQLEDTNKKVREQEKSLEKLPKLTADLEASKKRVQYVVAQQEEYAKTISQLEKEKVYFKRKLALSTKAGFDRGVEIAVVLEPSIDFRFLDAKYQARDGKIVFGDEVVYDPEAPADSPALENANEDGKNAAGEDVPVAE